MEEPQIDRKVGNSTLDVLGRSVVEDDQLKRQVLLGKHTGHGFGEKPRIVMNRNDHADQGRRFEVGGLNRRLPADDLSHQRVRVASVPDLNCFGLRHQVPHHPMQLGNGMGICAIVVKMAASNSFSGSGVGPRN